MIHETDTLNLRRYVLALETSGTPAAGNLVGAAAAASTQYALANPVGSGVLLVLSKLIIAPLSGTPGAGYVAHGLIANVPTLAASGVPANTFVGGPGSRAKAYASAGGAALTGGLAPTVLRASSIFFPPGATTTWTTASVCQENIEGDIIIPEGYTWVPLFKAAGTTFLVEYSLTWEERPK